jgi:hypothetical protein
VGFIILDSQQYGHSVRSFCIVFECMYVGFSGDIHVYTSFLKERHVHLEKNEKKRSYNRLGFARVCRYCI